MVIQSKDINETNRLGLVNHSNCIGLPDSSELTDPSMSYFQW
jgi:hypothetical protein